MNKQFKLMIFVNILLGLLFVAFNFMYSNLATGEHRGLWGSLWITFYNIHSVGDIGVQYPNFAFYFFWVLMIVNVYFVYRLQRSKETKQTPS
jgi:hypothetical protein